MSVRTTTGLTEALPTPLFTLPAPDNGSIAGGIRYAITQRDTNGNAYFVATGYVEFYSFRSAAAALRDDVVFETEFAGNGVTTTVPPLALTWSYRVVVAWSINDDGNDVTLFLTCKRDAGDARGVTFTYDVRYELLNLGDTGEPTFF